MTCVLTLIGLRVVAWGSSEVLLSGLLDASHLSAKNQFRGMGLTSGRCPHDITDSYLLKMTPEPGSRLKFVDALTDGGGVMPTPDCRHPNPYCIVCVSLDCFAEDCFAEDTMYGLMPLAFCNALSCW